MTTAPAENLPPDAGVSDFVWRRAHTVVLAMMCLAQLIDSLDVTIVNVALPSIRHGLSMSASDLPWVVNAYAVVFGGFLLLGGRLGDLTGRRRLFLAGVTFFTLASSLAGLAPDSRTLIAARAVQGLAAALVAPTTLAILASTFPEGRPRSRAFAAWGVVTGVSSSLGVLLGGVITDALDWRWIFFLNVPIGVFVVAVSARRLARDLPSPGQAGADWTGSVASVAGTGLLCYAFAQTADSGWGVRTLILVAVAIAVLALFIAHERRATAPLVPLSLFHNRSVAGANIASVLVGTGMLGMFYFISLYQQQVLRASPLQAGLAYLPLTAVLAIAAFFAPPLMARIGVRMVVVVGCLLAAAGLCVFATAAPDRGVWADIIGPSLIVSPGLALTFIPLTLAAVTGVSAGQNGIAAGLVNASRSTGSAVGLAALATVAATWTAGATRAGRPALDALSDGFRVGFLVSAGAMVVAGLAALALFRSPRSGE